MTEYISREAAIEAIEETDWYHQNKNKDMVHGANSLEHQAWYKEQDVFAALKSIPAADVRPVEWIPVTERLPEKDGWYLVSDGFISWTAMFLGEKTVWAGNFKFGLTGITHWMPLPEPPKEET